MFPDAKQSPNQVLLMGSWAASALVHGMQVGLSRPPFVRQYTDKLDVLAEMENDDEWKGDGQLRGKYESMLSIKMSKAQK